MPKQKWDKLSDEDEEEFTFDEGFDEDFDFDAAEEVDTGEEEEVEGKKVRKKKEVPPGKVPWALCHKCPLYPMPMVPSYGPPDAEVIIVGEAPGQEEVVDKKPFVGQSGALLRSVVGIAGYDANNAFITNAVLCRPPSNRTPKSIEVRCCRQRLLEEIKEHKSAQTIVALGKVANKIFNKEFQPGDRGLWKEYDNLWLIGTWHPAYVLRKPKTAVQFIPDIRKAFQGHHAMERFLRQPDVIIVESLDQLREMLSRYPSGEYVAFDLETDNVTWYDRPGKKADSIILLAMAWCDEYAIIIDDAMLYDVRGIKETLAEFFNRPDVRTCGHNGKFDQLFLLSHLNMKVKLDFDTMLAHYILDENSPHGLKQIAREVFGLGDYEKDLVQKHLTSRNDSYSKVPFEDLAQYASWDVVLTRALAELFEKQIRNEGMWEWPWSNIIMPAAEMFVDVEYRGIQTDMHILPKAQAAMEIEIAQLEDEASRLYKEGINLQSPQQVIKLLYDDLRIPVPTVDGRPFKSSSRAAVNSLVGKHPFVDLLIYYRRIAKLKSSYIENMLMYVDTNGRVHPTFWIHGTEMGRLSARNPAIQTIPRPGDKWIDTVGTRVGPLTDGALIRGCFRSTNDDYYLSTADYSQAELRTVACLAQEPFLMDVYRNKRDLHTEVAISMYGPSFQKEERQRCKMFNFSYIYGGNEYSFAQDAGLDIAKAKQFVQQYNKVMPRLAKYRVEQYNLMLQQGYVETLFKRRRRFVLITDRNKDEVRKACVHAPVAGTASDLTLLSAIRLWRDDHIPVILLVHDSVLADTHKSVAFEVSDRIAEVMRKTGEEFLPEVPWLTDTETVTHWSEAPVL